MKRREFSEIKMSIIAILVLLHVYEVSSQCSGTTLTLTAMSGTSSKLTSPDYPQNYPNNADCNWLIDAGGAGYRVGIIVHLLNTEDAFDQLIVYDGNSASSSVLVTLQGSATNVYYETTSKYMFLHFTSDMSVSKVGFWLQYFTVFDSFIGQLQKITCSPASSPVSITVTTSLSMQFALGTFPAKYSGNDYCAWTIDVGAGQFLNLSIVATDSEYGAGPGGLKIFDGSSSSDPELAYISDKSQVEDNSVVVGTSSQYAYFEYRRNSVGLYRGMILKLNRVSTPPPQLVTVPAVNTVVVQDTCGTEYLNSTNTSVNYISSPNYPFDYNNDASCTWIITASNTNQTVNLTFSAIDIEECCDALYIYDGDSDSSALIATITGQYNTSSLPSITSTGSSLMLRFVTDSRNTNTGFTLEYTSVAFETPACVNQTSYTTLTASTTQQTFDSHPGYNGVNSTYSSNYDAHWIIEKPSESDTLYVTLTKFYLEVDVDCTFDYIKIYQGICLTSPLLNTVCGYLAEGTTYTYSSEKYVLVHFHSDFSMEHLGFRITYYIGSTPTTGSDSSGDNLIPKIVGAVIGICLLILLIMLCCCCIRKCCYGRTSTLKRAAKMDMKRNLIIVNTNKPKPHKIPRKKKKGPSVYPIDKPERDPGFPIMGPGIHPVAPPFPGELKRPKMKDDQRPPSPTPGVLEKNVVSGVPPLVVQNKKTNQKQNVNKSETDSLSSSENTTSTDKNVPKVIPLNLQSTASAGEPASPPLNPQEQCSSVIPPPFDYQPPWQLRKD